MSKNLAQVFAANPVTTIGNTDLFYIVTTGTTDAGINGLNLKAAVSPLSAKGDLFGYSTTNTRIAVAVGNGKILQVDSTAAAGLSYSTPTYPSASGTLGKFLISDGTNNVYSTSTIPTSAGAVPNKILLSDGTNYVLSSVTFPNAAATSGKIVISDGTNWIASTSIFPNTVGLAGTILRSNGTVNAYTTATFADTYGANDLLYSNGANTVQGLATANSAALVTSSTGVPAWSSSMTNGQVIVGSTGATPVAATVGSSGNISITVGAGSLSIGTTGFASFAWNDVSGTTQAAAANNGYIISNAAQTTVTIPATIAEGSIISIAGKGAAGWILQANTGQVIHLGSSATSSAGSLTSTNQWDSVSIVCVTANTTFVVTSVIGNLTVA